MNIDLYWGAAKRRFTAMAPLLLILSNCFGGPCAQSRGGSVGDEAQQPGKSEGAAVSIEFREFFEAGAGELKPSAKLLGLNGRRARLVGFMAQMEQPPGGAFYLCSTPVFADESGGGTADLPVGSVRVIVRSAKGKKITFIARPIEVTGILEVGPRAEEDGTVSSIRLILDAPQKSVNSAAPSSPVKKHGVKPKASYKYQRSK
jgi:hypothetical protein